MHLAVSISDHKTQDSSATFAALVQHLWQQTVESAVIGSAKDWVRCDLENILNKIIAPGREIGWFPHRTRISEAGLIPF